MASFIKRKATGDFIFSHSCKKISTTAYRDANGSHWPFLNGAPEARMSVSLVRKGWRWVNRFDLVVAAFVVRTRSFVIVREWAYLLSFVIENFCSIEISCVCRKVLSIVHWYSGSCRRSYQPTPFRLWWKGPSSFYLLGDGDLASYSSPMDEGSITYRVHHWYPEPPVPKFGMLCLLLVQQSMSLWIALQTPAQRNTNT